MSSENENRVVVVDVKMPFWSMVSFMVKLAIAAIPAFLILSILSAVVMALFGGAFMSMRGTGGL